MTIDHHLVIATTNDSSDLSDALLRPSRMDLRIVIDYPSENSRREFFTFKGVVEDDLEDFVNQTKSFSMSELKEVFIGTYVLGKSLKHVVAQIKEPLIKQKYESFKHNKKTIGF